MRRLAVTASFLLIGLTSSISSAYDVLMCATTRLGIETNTTFYTDQCNVPPGSAAEADFKNAAYTWNKLAGVHDRFTVALGNTNCAALNMRGNGRSDYQDQQNLNGNAGLAWYNGSTATPPSCTDSEWDVLTATGATLGVPPVATNGVYRRTVLVHELGHVLGAHHETSGQNTFPASMATFLPGPVIGGGGAERSGVMGDDMLFARAFHGFANSSSDVAASAWTEIVNARETDSSVSLV